MVVVCLSEAQFLAGTRDVFSPGQPYGLLSPTCHMLTGYRSSFPRVERPGCEVYRLPSASPEVTNEWSDTSTPALCLCGVGKENDSCIFIVIFFFWNGRKLRNEC